LGLASAARHGLSQAADILTEEYRETHRKLGKGMSRVQPPIYIRKYYLRLVFHRREILTAIRVLKRGYLDVNEIPLQFGTGAIVPGVLRLPEERVLFAREEIAWQRLPSASTG
jgi:hypothetical protein